MKGIIYMYTAPNGKMYIGQTYNEASRKSCFKNLNKSYSNGIIDKARHKYGPENFKYEILCTIYSNIKKDLLTWLNALEIFFIKKYDSINKGYNINRGGDKRTPEEVDRQRAFLKKYYETHDNPFKGKKHTEENKKYLSYLASKRTGDKNPFYGKTHSEEMRKNQSIHMISRMGDPAPKYGENGDLSLKEYLRKQSSKAVLQIDPNTNEVIAEYPSAREAARSIGKPKIFYGISNVCKGFNSDGTRANLAGGFKWKFKEGSTTSKSSDNTEAYTQVGGNGGLSINNRDEDIV